MIEPKNFENIIMPPDSFELMNVQLEIDGKKIRNLDLRAAYDRHNNLSIYHIEKFDPEVMMSARNDIKLSGSKFPEEIHLLETSKQSNFSKDGKREINSILTPSREPLLMDLKGNAAHVTAVVINGPDLFFHNSELNFEYYEYEITINEFENTRNTRKQKASLKYENVATGLITLTSTKKKIITPEEALRVLGHFYRFLCFVRGGRCGIGHITGYSKNGDLAFVHLGFMPTDPFQVSVGWCDRQVVKSLPEVYQDYEKSFKNDTDNLPIMRSIEFYRSSNMIRNSSTEMALVASHAALETLVPYLLTQRAGWSKDLMSKQIKFSDKLRAAFNYIGISDDPFRHLNELKKRAKSESNIDAYDIVSLFRNRIVHQGKVFKYTGVELFEVWQLSQWFCEVILLYWFGYRGDMNDRRRYSGWRGDLVPVPLTATDNVMQFSE
jgi:hypothetical protein